MRLLIKLVLGLICYFLLGLFSEVDASILASQTTSFADTNSSPGFSQDLGTNLSGLANSITVRITTASTIDYLAQNSFLVDKTNNYQIVTKGCTKPTQDTHDQKRGLTITTGGAVPVGYQDVTIDLSCANYNFVPGHFYYFVFLNANTFNPIFFTGHRGSHSDHQDLFPGGGVRYAASGFNVNNCYLIAGNFPQDYTRYVTGCYSWDTGLVGGIASDDLYFHLDGTPPITAVIFIPGIGGSELQASQDIIWSKDNGHGGTFSHAYPSGEKIWVNQTEAAKPGDDDYFDVLRLKSDGITSEAPLSLNGYLTPYGYGEVDSFFQSLGYTKGTNYFVFPYDWRMDVSGTKQALDSLVEQAKQKTGQTQVNIVAHSMGGLVARNYIKDASSAAKIKKLVELGVPHLGATWATEAVMYGILFGKPLIGGFGIGVAPSEVYDVTHNLTGAFELFPSSTYFNFYNNSDSLHPAPFFDDRDVDNNKVTGPLNYSQIKNLLSNLNYNMTVFNLSENFHNSVDPTLSQTNSVKLYEIVGSGIPTLGQIKETWWLSWPFNLIPKRDEIMVGGDDTVPEYSASLKSINLDLSAGAKIYYVNQRHEDLPKQSGDAMGIVKKILAEDTTLTENQKLTLDGIQVSIDGSNIDLYDNSGNHTGLTSDGSVEENIPNTYYSGSDNTKHVFIKKTAPTVKVTIKPTKVTSTTGTTSSPKKITVRTRTYSSDQVQSVNLYPQINVTDTTEVHTNIDPQSTTPPTLTSFPDSNSANTNTGGTVIPTPTQVSDTNTLDQTPPTTIIATSGTTNSSGTYIGSATITLATTDASGSGVLETDYSLDNSQTTQIYTNPVTISSTGTTTVQVSATDKVGNQEVPHTIAVTVVPAPILPTTSVTTTSNTSSTSTGGDTISQILAASTQVSNNTSDNLKNVAQEVRQIVKTTTFAPTRQQVLGTSATAQNNSSQGTSVNPLEKMTLGELLATLASVSGVLSLALGASFLGSFPFFNKFPK